jgi:hypothetical protein
MTALLVGGRTAVTEAMISHAFRLLCIERAGNVIRRRWRLWKS